MKAMLYADWMNLRRSMKAILIVVAVIAVASLTAGKQCVVRVVYSGDAVADGARNADEQ